MLLALPALASEGFQVNAHGCRQYGEALSLLRGLAAAHALPHEVVIALGADGSVTSGDVRQTLNILGRGRVLVLVTPRELGGGSGADASTVRQAGRRYRTRVRVLDWVALGSAGHGDWFQPDGLHLTFNGAAAFAGLLRQVLVFARSVPQTIIVDENMTAAPGPRVSLRARMSPPDGWQLLARSRVGGLPHLLFRTQGGCGYRVTLLSSGPYSSTARDSAQVLAGLMPPRVNIWRFGLSPRALRRRATWVVWRAPSGLLAGGAWTAGLGDLSPRLGGQYLNWLANTFAARRCGSSGVRQIQEGVFSLLASLRVDLR